MIFDSPVEFVEAVRHLARKGLMPTGLSSRELRGLDAAIRRQALFSARTTQEGYLEELRGVLESIVNPQQVMREAGGRTVTEGFNPATARVQLREYLKGIGYEPEEGKAGSIEDLASEARVDLVVDTNVKLAHGAGRYVQQNKNEDVLDLWPALELVRFESREEPRDWEGRWRVAARVAGDAAAARCLDLHGRMAALKSSGIWQALGDGAGGHEDTLGNPYPPFAFRSGMWTEEVSRDEAEELELIKAGERAEGAELEVESLFKAEGAE